MAVYGDGRHFTLVRCRDDAEWLAQRTLGVGGSDVAAIMGVSPWRTPAEVWLEKTGRETNDIGDRPYVRFGNLMEPHVGRWYAERHPDRTVRRVNAICRSIERPWAQASLDYEVRDEGRWGVLEIKTARDASDWSDGVPTHYLTQVVHYMEVTHREYADVAVFFRDSCEFAEYRVELDPEDAATVREAVDGFWHDYVLTDTMPELVGTEGEARSLTRAFGAARDDAMTQGGRDADMLVAAYIDAREREKQAKADKAEAATKLIGLIGESKGLLTPWHRATWVRSSRETLDAKALREEMPDVYRRYVRRQVVNGGIRVTEING